jgi:hypothetical protein
MTAGILLIIVPLQLGGLGASRRTDTIWINEL